MKYKTFRTLAILGVIVVGGATLYSVRPDPAHNPPAAIPSAPGTAPIPAATRAETSAKTRPPTSATSSAAATTGTAAATSSGEATVLAAGDPLRYLDRRVVRTIEQGISGSRKKDAYPSESWKANFYKDTGARGVNRVKIDLDRDERWDEKWTITRKGSDYTIKRQVSPKDDDQTYSVEFTLAGDRWIAPMKARTGAGTAANTPPAPTARPTPTTPPVRSSPATPTTSGDVAAPGPDAGGVPLRRLDTQILNTIDRGIAGAKKKDAFPTQAWKANLYKDAGEGGVNRVKIDLDRDERWDEKWTLTWNKETYELKRQISPTDDDRTYSVEYRLRHGRWVPK